MSTHKTICAFIQMYNESTKGNLVRCLENVTQWADEIVIYDDASTDDSVDIAKGYTPHIIEGEANSFYTELQNKQRLLELALSLPSKPDWIMWIDCDEILDRTGTLGGLDELIKKDDGCVDAYQFHELNLWRSHTYARTDTLFNSGWFCRLWRVVPSISFNVVPGVHRRLHPQNIRTIKRSDVRVIHYGHSDYIAAMVKQGFAFRSDEEFQELAKKSWIFNETECNCYRVPDYIFPVENIPEDKWEQPKPRTIESLECYRGTEYDIWRQYAQV